MLYPQPSSTGKPRLARLFAGPWLLAVVIFAAALTLYTRHNDFPYTYHPDERGKAFQLVEKSRNFHHPLLLLNLTDWAARLTGTERTPQKLVVVGRWVSAAFAAGAIAALALIAWLHYGALAGWAAGLLLLFEAELFKTAHYLKEDPALLFGLALSLLAAHLWWQRPGRGTLQFLGVACALAAAGKYLGIVTLIFALPLVWRRTSDDPALALRTRWKVFAAAFGIAFLLANLPFPVSKISSPFRQIGREMEGVVGGHRGLTREVPHAIYLGALRGNTPLPIAICAAAYVILLAATARRRSPVEWLTVLFPAAYLAMLSFSPKVADRYLLPVDVLVTFLAALGAAEFTRLLFSPRAYWFRGAVVTGLGVIGAAEIAEPLVAPLRWRRVFAGLFLAGLTAWMLSATIPHFRSLLGEYQTDSHAAAAAWIKAHLPADAIIAEDHRVNLSAEKSNGVSTTARVPQTVLNADFAADLGTLDKLRARGVTHVAIGPDAFKRFFDPRIKPGKKEQANYDRRKAFYAQVFTEGECLIAWPRREITYLHPGILLYRVAPLLPNSLPPN